VIIAVVVVASSIGGELAEAPLFMVPAAGASAAAIVGVAALDKRRVRRSAARRSGVAS
jgi:hypothetical protein